MKKDLIKLVENFESKEEKRYWIFRIDASDATKGFLLIHFKLI